MSRSDERLQEIIYKIAQIARQQPELNSGLWFHSDIRDNFYYASYLFTDSTEGTIDRATATRILLKVLQLQDVNPNSDTYGHWPLRLEPNPQEAKPNTLPVELMGSLMAFFFNTYSSEFSPPLRHAFESALAHIYHSNFYRKPLHQYNHHEAKYTATKLIFGQMFGDEGLTEDGVQCLRETLSVVQQQGMHEYGALPWFWHWVQAYTCAWTLVDNPDIKTTLSDMLDLLWKERAQYYLKGTWVGAHSRGLRHDIPQDTNVLFDYVQFGDFSLPEAMPRTEYAGFLFYEAPDSAKQIALNRDQPTEVTKLVTKTTDSQIKQLHSYVYITESFASGGMWERFNEFDNEQHRWDVTLPLITADSVNKAFFFHPGNGYAEHDPRHQSEFAEVLYHKNVIIALYPIPETYSKQIIGVLPKGLWLQEPQALFGATEQLYWSVYTMQPYQMEELTDRHIITSEGTPNGVVIEVMSCQEAEQRDLRNLQEFAALVRLKPPFFNRTDALKVDYINLNQESLQLSVHKPGHSEALINGHTVDLGRYVR